MKVKIIRLSKKDAWWNRRKEIVGLVGRLENDLDMGNGWKGGRFCSDTSIEELTSDKYLWFAFIKFEQMEEEIK